MIVSLRLVKTADFSLDVWLGSLLLGRTPVDQHEAKTRPIQVASSIHQMLNRHPHQRRTASQIDEDFVGLQKPSAGLSTETLLLVFGIPAVRIGDDKPLAIALEASLFGSLGNTRLRLLGANERQRATLPALQSAEYKTPGVVPSAVISKRPWPPPNSGTESCKSFSLLQNSFTFLKFGRIVPHRHFLHSVVMKLVAEVSQLVPEDCPFFLFLG